MTTTFQSEIQINFQSLPSGISFNDLQKKILERLINGESYKSIAYSLNLSMASIRQQAHRSYKKLNVANRTEALIRYGVKG